MKVFAFKPSNEFVGRSSVLLNVVLLAVVAFLLGSRQAMREPTAAAPALLAVSTTNIMPPLVISNRSTPPSLIESHPSGNPTSADSDNAGRPAVHWSQLESPDFRQYIANLRSIGCPELTIRDIIVRELDELYASRLRELFPAAEDLQPGASFADYWENPEFTERIRGIVAEKEETLRALLGDIGVGEAAPMHSAIERLNRELTSTREPR